MATSESMFRYMPSSPAYQHHNSAEWHLPTMTLPHMSKSFVESRFVPHQCFPPIGLMKAILAGTQRGCKFVEPLADVLRFSFLPL